MLQPTTRYFLGLDIGGTYIKACVIDENGVQSHKVIEKTNATEGKDAVLERVVVIAQRLIQQAQPRIVQGIGVGICGPTNSATGTLITTPILIGWTDVPISAILSDACHLPVVVDNDANLALYGETWLGVAQSKHNVVGFTVGTGIGGGIIINDQIYHGSRYFGGEVGHMTVRPGGRLCPCGNHGCLNVEGSTQATIERYQQSKSCLDEVSMQTIYEEAKQGEHASLKAIAPTIEALSIGIANLMNIFDPDIVIIAGGLTLAGEWIRQRIAESVQQRVYPDLFTNVPIKLATLTDMAGAIGAAFLASKQTNVSKSTV